MIESIRVVNFKSLGEVSLRLGKFNCLIGMNGAGKSTLLQVFDFLSQLMVGDIDAWLDQRGWDVSDLHCKLRRESNITLNVTYRCADGRRLTWVGVFNRQVKACTQEFVADLQAPALKTFIFQVKAGSFSIAGAPYEEVKFTHQGSLLSALKDSELPPGLLEFRNALRRIRSLELLSPQLLRKRARSSDRDIGAGGEKLSAYLDTVKGQARGDLITLLQRFYPTLQDFKVTSMRSGWKRLSVIEKFGGRLLETDATHLNDGLLRILAVLAQAASDRSLILLDEIENGINQEVVEGLVDTLVASPQQVLVTTHSPLILNYLEDDVARTAVQFVYKAADGETRVRPFFEIPRIGDKLRSMGPGDAFVDTDLRALGEECMRLDHLAGPSEETDF